MQRPRRPRGVNERSDKERKYTTVMTTMARFDKKGLLVRILGFLTGYPMVRFLVARGVKAVA